MTAALDMNEWPCRIRGYLVSMAMSHLWLPCIRGHVVSVATLYPCRICVATLYLWRRSHLGVLRVETIPLQTLQAFTSVFFSG